MTQHPYVIDSLLASLRKAWADLGVSAEEFAAALQKNKRKPLHPNTLRKLPNPRWSPSISTLRDLEDVLIRTPLQKEGMRKCRKLRTESIPPQGASVVATPM
jgi:hypothetical protein